MSKKSKILLALLLVLVMVMTAACSGSDKDITKPAEVSGDSSVTPSDVSGSEDSADAEITIAETVLYEADGVKVTATGYEDGWMGPEVKVLVENTSSNNVLVTTESVAVNGYMMPVASLYAEWQRKRKPMSVCP